MIEKAVTFGREQSLVGVLCEPAAGGRAHGVPGVLFWNVGLLPRVGPYRLYVELARRLAALGIPSLRFDLSGLGDSPASAEKLPRRERVAAEIKTAMSWMAEHAGCETFVLVGLCSGADDTHRAAVAEPRVRGAVLVDGYGYPTTRFRVRRYWYFLSSPRRVARYLERKFGEIERAFSAVSPEESPRAEEEFGWEMPPRAQVQEEIRKVVERGTRLLYVYSGEVHTYYNYKEQFRDMFPGLDSGGMIQYEYLRDADHIFSHLPSRMALMDLILTWVRNGFLPSGNDGGR